MLVGPVCLRRAFHNQNNKKMKGQPGLLQNIRKQIHIAQQANYKRWQDELKALKLEYIRRTAPGFFEASGSYTMKIKPYSDKTTNGLTRCVLDFLIHSGFYANRINTQGQARIKRIPKFNVLAQRLEHHQKVEYTKSATRKGTPDIDSIIYGIPVKIEIKVGEDRQSDYQRDEQKKIEAAGGKYFIAETMPSFLAWFKNTFYK